MASKFFFVLDSPESRNFEPHLLSSITLREENLLVSSHSNGIIIFSKIRSSGIQKILSLSPNFVSENQSLIKFCEVKSPYNKLGQFGRLAILALYGDGRLRLWDTDSGNCFLQSAKGAIEKPEHVELIGSTLHSKKRFAFICSTGGRMTLCDLWTFEKQELELPSRNQLVDFVRDGNVVFLLDVDQKLTIVDFSFLESSDSISSEKIAYDFRKNCQVRFLPLRSTQNRIEDSVRLENYRMKVFTQMFVLENLLLLFSQNLVQILRVSDFFESKAVTSFESRKKFSEIYPLLVGNILEVVVEKTFLVSFKGSTFFVCQTEDKELFSISSSYVRRLWSQAENSKSEEKRLEVDFALTKINISLNSSIVSVIPTDESLILRSKDETFKIDFSEFFEKNEELVFETRSTHQESQSSFLRIFSVTSLPEENSKKSFFEVILSKFSPIFQRYLTSNDLKSILYAHFSERDEIKLETIASIGPKKGNFLLLITSRGNILAIPLQVPIKFNKLTKIELFYCPIECEGVTKLYFAHDSVVLVKDDQLVRVSWVKSSTFRKVSISNPSERVVQNKFKLFGIEISPKHRALPLCSIIKEITPLRALSSPVTQTLFENSYVLRSEQNSIQVVLLPQMLTLVDEINCDSPLLTSCYDQEYEFLHLFFENGSVIVFRFDLSEIESILEHQTLIDNRDDLQNLIKDQITKVKAFNVSFESMGIFKKVLKNFYETYIDFDSTQWFEQTSSSRPSSFNANLLRSLRIFFNFNNFVLLDLSQISSNNKTILKETKDFRDGKSPESFQLQTSKNYEKKFGVVATAINQSVSKPGCLLNNIKNDRFFFAREALGSLPVLFHLAENRRVISAELKERYGLSSSVDEVFLDVFRHLMEDLSRSSLKAPISEGIESLDLRKIGFELGYSINLKTQSSLKNPHVFQEIFFSNFSGLLMKLLPSSESLRFLIRSAHIKTPLLKIKLGFQGVGTSMTLFEDSIDSSFFQSVISGDEPFFEYVRLNLLIGLLSYVISVSGVNLDHSIELGEQLFHFFYLSPSRQFNTFALMLNYFSDSEFAFGGCNFLLNAIRSLSQNNQICRILPKRLQSKDIISFYNQYASLQEKAADLSKVDLSLLATVLIQIPNDEWWQVNRLKETSRSIFQSIEMNRIVKSPFFMISIFKFISKLEPQLYNLLRPEHESLSFELPIIYLFVSLSFPKEHHEGSISEALIDVKHKNNVKIKEMIEEVRTLPMDLRITLRNLILKLHKILVDVNTPMVLRAFGKILHEYQSWELPQIAVLELLRYLIRNSGEGFEEHLNQILKLILTIIDPRRSYMKKQSSIFVTHVFSTIQFRFQNVAFNQATQKCAVGGGGQVILYNLENGSEWAVLSSHEKKTDSMSFSERGDFLASFSLEERKILVWNLADSGFFAAFRAKKGKPFRAIDVGQELRNVSWKDFEGKKLRWKVKLDDSRTLLLKERLSERSWEFSI